MHRLLPYKNILMALGILVLLLLGIHQIHWRWDITQDQRYSLSNAFKEQLEELENPVVIDIFLEGNLPPQYFRLRGELATLLDAVKSEHKSVRFQFVDPFQGDADGANVIQEMMAFGLLPETVFENTQTSVNESVIFPWAIINYGQRSVRVALLQKNLGDTEDEKIRRSIQLLEYQLMDGIHRATLETKKNIAVLTSHGTSEELKLADLLQSLSPYYNLAAFDLRAEEISPRKSLENLQRFEMLLVPNPQTPFSNEEKFIIDQYTLKGGKSLWLLNGISIDRDSLYNTTGEAYGFPNELNLDDLFFKYGIRLRRQLVKDMYCAPIVMAQGLDNNANFTPFPWMYYPLPRPLNTVVGKDVGSVLLQFANPIDTLANEVEKNILLRSSPFTKTQGIPAMVQLQQATQPIDPKTFDGEAVPLAVLLEGTFPSLYANRIKPFEMDSVVKKGVSKMVIISDGNFAENQINKGQPLALGFDKWTNNFYGNKDFLMNCIHLLAANEALLDTRKKTVELPLLSPEKTLAKGGFWKTLMLTLPVLIAALFWSLHFLFVVRKYRK